MRKSLRAALAALALAAASVGAFVPVTAAAVQRDEPIVGNYREARVNDPDVLAAARFAVNNEGQRHRQPVRLLAVRRAERQVVAGYNYRLELSIGFGYGGEKRGASAVVYQNPQNVYTLTDWKWAESGVAAAARAAWVYLVALDDKGKRGRKIGCEDSLVPVMRPAGAAGGNRLKAAVEALLATPRESEGGLNNYWHSDDLRVTSAAVRRGTATIRFRGTLPVAGVCDEPRIEEQIGATARRVPGVRRVSVFVNGVPLRQAIR